MKRTLLSILLLLDCSFYGDNVCAQTTIDSVVVHTQSTINNQSATCEEVQNEIQRLNKIFEVEIKKVYSIIRLLYSQEWPCYYTWPSVRIIQRFEYNLVHDELCAIPVFQYSAIAYKYVIYIKRTKRDPSLDNIWYSGNVICP